MSDLLAQSVFPHETLAAWSQRADAYRRGEPFPHLVIDDFLPAPVLEAAIAAYPGPEALAWGEKARRHARRKLHCRDEALFPPMLRHVLRELNSERFRVFLEGLTGISGLIPDVTLEGGGLHQILPGGFLSVHADFNVHPLFRLDRRLNGLLYLNEDWDPAYGGALELWDSGMTRCVRSVEPVANRFVVFGTTDTSFHGHPDPLTCPPERTRKSVAVYYYTNGRPVEERSAAHSTLYQDRPGERGDKQRSRLREVAGGVAKRILRRITGEAES